ncbi:MAG: AAA family ATPase [Terriglobales bacterium]
MAIRKATKKRPLQAAASSIFRKHFGARELRNLVTAARDFPITSRPDVQRAIEGLLASDYEQAVGIHPQYVHETLTISHVLAEGPYPILIGPLQHQDVDTGDVEPVRCIKHAIWTRTLDKLPYAILLTPAILYGQPGGVHVEIAVPSGEAGLKLSRKFFRELESRVHAAGSYRGRVISLEASLDYSGRGGSIKVHRLPAIKREEVILPESTLRLLERNVADFIRVRPRMKTLGMSVKKGLLFYGAPGTGKTHTIRYLASQLPEHTTLLITAEQVAYLDDYFRLARFLQPAMLVIEDVDLIARSREEMRSGCEESLLNKLLNEMDGLREDAEILFVLTTNRPDQLEAALASRPGRIDQSIEFPLPHDDGRAKLVRLYSRGLHVPDDVVKSIVYKTKGSTPAFIKELMRRSAQIYLERGADGGLRFADVETAIEEMLFAGGTLNLKLLGGANPEASLAAAHSVTEN